MVALGKMMDGNVMGMGMLILGLVKMMKKDLMVLTCIKRKTKLMILHLKC